MRIEKPSTPSPLSKNIAGVILVLILGGVFFWLYTASQNAPAREQAALMQVPSSLPPLEIANFTGTPEVYSKKEKSWTPLKRGVLFAWGESIRTDSNSEVDIRAADQVVMRLKPNSEAERKAPASKDDIDRYQIHLVRGLILGATERKAETEKWLQVSTPAVVASIRGTVFAVKAEEGSASKSWVGVLRGTVDVTGRAKQDQVTVEALQRTETQADGTLSKPTRVSSEEWSSMKEAYELVETSAADEAEQLDLSREAGGLFSNVFDHGTFFTPKVGYAWRHFHKLEEGNIVLDVDYDVFPSGSFVGMYIKVRDVNIDDYEALQMKVKRTPEQAHPEAFRIEVKSKGQTLRAFSPKIFKQEWQTMQFPLRADKKDPISEITFVFSHAQVGENTRGSLRFSDIKLIPRKVVPAEAAQPVVPAATSDKPQAAPAA
jgi:hypothetical protein